MPIPLIVGPAAALVGIVAVFFVLRRKSVEKRSMYSARRSQIEHKVRAARQRTLTPHGRSEAPAEAPPAQQPVSPFAPTQAGPVVTYEPSAYEPPPAAIPPPPPGAPPPDQTPWEVGPAAAEPSPWDVGPAAPGQPPPFMAPQSEPEPYKPEPFTPAPAAPYQPSAPAAEPAWTPGAASDPGQASPAQATAAASWSVVSDSREEAPTGPPPKKKDKKGAAAAGSVWSLASGDSPGTEHEDAVEKKPSPVVAIAQYAVLVIGLVMVLIGVLVMVANSHVT